MTLCGLKSKKKIKLSEMSGICPRCEMARLDMDKSPMTLAWLKYHKAVAARNVALREWQTAEVTDFTIDFILNDGKVGILVPVGSGKTKEGTRPHSSGCLPEC